MKEEWKRKEELICLVQELDDYTTRIVLALVKRLIGVTD